MLGKNILGTENYCDSAGKKGDEETRRGATLGCRVREISSSFGGILSFEMPVDIQVEILTGV